MPKQLTADQIKYGDSILIDGRTCRVTARARVKTVVELDGHTGQTDEIWLVYQWSRSETRKLNLDPGSPITVP